mmetsp:Transcript_7421/g.33834  ORF Transcript_7421/g.33834 Transcript_7421/m.33834 type:complete len:659 (+) Transcript_7421:1216-3192(+)
MAISHRLCAARVSATATASVARSDDPSTRDRISSSRISRRRDSSRSTSAQTVASSAASCRSAAAANATGSMWSTREDIDAARSSRGLIEGSPSLIPSLAASCCAASRALAAAVLALAIGETGAGPLEERPSAAAASAASSAVTPRNAPRIVDSAGCSAGGGRLSGARGWDSESGDLGATVLGVPGVPMFPPRPSTAASLRRSFSTSSATSSAAPAADAAADIAAVLAASAFADAAAAFSSEVVASTLLCTKSRSICSTRRWRFSISPLTASTAAEFKDDPSMTIPSACFFSVLPQLAVTDALARVRLLSSRASILRSNFSLGVSPASNSARSLILVSVSSSPAMAASSSMTSISTSRWRKVLRSSDSSALSLGATFSLSRYAAVEAIALACRTCSSFSTILSASAARCFRRSATSADRLSTSTETLRVVDWTKPGTFLSSASISDWRPLMASIVSAVSAASEETFACTAATEDFTEDTIAFVSCISAISFLTSCTRPAMATASSLEVSPSASRFSTRLTTSASSASLDSCALKLATDAAADACCRDSSSATRLPRDSLSTAMESTWTNESLSSWSLSLTASSSPRTPKPPPGDLGVLPPPPGLLGDTGTPAGDANSVSTFIGYSPPTPFASSNILASTSAIFTASRSSTSATASNAIS